MQDIKLKSRSYERETDMQDSKNNYYEYENTKENRQEEKTHRGVLVIHYYYRNHYDI